MTEVKLCLCNCVRVLVLCVCSFTFMIVTVLLTSLSFCNLHPSLTSFSWFLLSFYQWAALPEEESVEIHLISHKLEKHLEWHKGDELGDGNTINRKMTKGEQEREMHHMQHNRGGVRSRAGSNAEHTTRHSSPPSSSSSSSPPSAGPPIAPLEREEHEEREKEEEKATSELELEEEELEEQLLVQELLEEVHKKNPVPNIINGFFNVVLMLFWISALTFSLEQTEEAIQV